MPGAGGRGGFERDEILRLARDRLQAVHPVAEIGLRAARRGLFNEIPARPGAAAARHEARIRVQNREVAIGAEGAEQRALLGVGVAQHRQRLMRVRRDDDVIMHGRAAGDIDQPHMLAVTQDGDDLAPEMQRPRQALKEPADIAAGSAGHRAPDRTASRLQQAVIGTKAHEGGGGVIAHGSGRRRPDGCGHGHDVVALEGGAVPPMVEISAEAQPLGFHQPKVPGGLGIEAAEVAQHRPEARTDQVEALSEEPAEIGAGIFKTTIIHRHREGHLGRHRRHAEMPEQGGQIGIGLFIVDDETGVDAERAVGGLHRDRVGVSARPLIHLVDRHAMALAQQPCT